MTPEELARLRPRLAEFVAEMLGCLARADQRDKGQWYLRGLLLDGRRKSMQPMAERLGIDHQRLQQFMTSSTWDVMPVRRNLAVWGQQMIGPRAHVVDDSGFPKDGDASACVAHQYCGQVGKNTNCQVGVSVHLVTNHASVAVNWRLFCPASWDDQLAETAGDLAEAEQIRVKRAKAGVMEEVRHREKWRLALDMLDELSGSDQDGSGQDGSGQAGGEQAGGGGWGLPRLPVVADCGYGDNTLFRLGLEERGRGYMVAVRSDLSGHPADAEPLQRAYSGRGRPPKPAYPNQPVSVKDLVLTLGRDAFTDVTWRQGTKKTKENPTAQMTSQFLLATVRPANRNIPRADDGSLPARLLLVEWPDDADEPTDYWLSNLPADTTIEHLVDLAKIRWRIEHDYRELKTGLGLGHFEGRSWTGWHRHVTLVCLAQAFLTMLRLDPKAPAPA
jgi:SRSO17 transposase